MTEYVKEENLLPLLDAVNGVLRRKRASIRDVRHVGYFCILASVTALIMSGADEKDIDNTVEELLKSIRKDYEQLKDDRKRGDL